MFKAAKMNLRKWSSNKKELIEKLPAKDLEELSNFDGSSLNETIKTLVIIWNPSTDSFKFVLEDIDWNAVFTKKSLLSDINKMFDPLGIIGPIKIVAKIIMQELWIRKIDWDQELPEELKAKYRNYREDVKAIEHINVKRCIIPLKNVTKAEIHGFADASEKAYGACVYLKVTDDNDNIEINLLCSKSRVAPLKQVTLARLELCAAVILARLVTKVVRSLKLDLHSICLWQIE
jgi:hypothetical protein